MTTFSQKVMERIRTEGIKPLPRWYFQAGKVLAVFGLIVSVVIGAFSAGLTISLVRETNLLEFLRYREGISIFLSGIPYVWIAAAIASIILATTDFVKTFGGYRYKFQYVAGVILVGIISTGFVTNAVGFSPSLERYMEENVPIYSQLTRTPQEFWYQPEAGLLYGEVEIDPGCNCIRIKDGNNDTWEVDKLGSETEKSFEEASEGPVKIIGEKTGDNKFHIKKIIPGLGKGRLSGDIKGAEDERGNKKKSRSSDDKNNRSDKNSVGDLKSK